MSAIDVLAFTGGLLIIGFFAQFLFKKINLPDILILLALGYLIGPVFNIVDPASIRPASQVISVLSLVVILFSESLNIEFRKIIRSAPRALILIILDGWGLAPPSKGNAIGLANTPIMDMLSVKYPSTELFAHGEYVGLPKGQVGNSEAGQAPDREAAHEPR